jgi:hypothetical protein
MTLTTNKPNIDRTFGHIDRATGDDAPHVLAEYTLKTDFPLEGPQQWKLQLRMPVAVHQALNSADWDEVLEKFQKRSSLEVCSPFERMILEARLAGVPAFMLQHKVNKQIARALYRNFSARQIQQGNKAWAAPSSMTKVTGADNG